MPDETTPCPWCREGRIIRHGPAEPWEVEETGERGHAGTEHFMAGVKRVRFTTAPTWWFSCTSCAMTGTVEYLRVVLARTIPRPGR